MNKTSALLILGNHLFPPHSLPLGPESSVFMAEDFGLYTHFRYHKHKIILFLSAMRSYAESLRTEGFEVSYNALEPENCSVSFEEKLRAFLETNQVQQLYCFEVEDKFFENRIRECCRKHDVSLVELDNPMFLVRRESFKDYLKKTKKPFLAGFYEQVRRKTGLFMEDDGSPVGGKFSFDAENRKKLPKNKEPRPPKIFPPTNHTREVSALCELLFSDHPGSSEEFWLPTTREQSREWFQEFLTYRLGLFGDYEDAISRRSPFVYHSVLSPLLNLGLLTPEEVLLETLEFAKENRTPLNSIEGFLRQVLGWREFVRGIYQNFSEEQDASNFWKHNRPIGRCWYDGTTGLPPVDDAIRKVLRYGYTHHIERLMILGNVMLLSEICPQDVHRWFMEMYVDSSDWVMGPNVYGMSQFSDGGIFATKPYICGSNYILSMSDYERGDWCDVLDGLYWSFVEKHREFYAKNPRTRVIVGNLERLDPLRKSRIYSAADEFRTRSSVSE